MDEKKAREASDDSSNPFIEPSATSEYVGEAEDNVANTNKQKEDCKQKDKEACKPVVNIHPEDNKPQMRANTISWIAVGVNAILALFTYLLFLQNSDAIGESKTANTIAQNTLDNSRFNDSINRINDSLQRIDDSTNNRQTVDLANKSLDAQIEALKESQRQFEDLNRPILQMKSVKLRNYGIGRDFYFRYLLSNIGNYPVQITKRRFGIIIETFRPSLDSAIDVDTIKPEGGAYLSKENNDSTYINYGALLHPAEYMLLHDHIGYIYFMGVIEYQNLITKEKGIYEFIIEYTPFPDGYNFIINRNRTLKEKKKK